MEMLQRIFAILAGVYLLSSLCHARSYFEHIVSAYPIDLERHSESFADIFRKNVSIGIELKKMIPELVGRIEEFFPLDDLRAISTAYTTQQKYKGFMDDVNAIHKALNEIPEGKRVSELDVFLVTLSYEFDAGCTAVMAIEHPGETVRLAHNLDFTDQTFFRKIYIASDFIRNKEKIFSCSGPAGNVGGMMCTRIGKYSISINEKNATGGTLRENLLAAKWPTMWLIREVLTTCSTYEEAVKKLNETETVSGSYLSIAGAKVGQDTKTHRYQGIILTKSSKAAAIHEEYLNSSNKFLIQCNTDWNNTNQVYMNDPTLRTKKGYSALKDINDSQLPQKFTSKQLRDNVLKSYPNLRVDRDPVVRGCEEGTVSLVSMEPSGPNPIESWIYWPNGDDCLDGSKCKEREGKNPFCCCDANGNKCLCCPSNDKYRCYNIAGNMCRTILPTHQMLRGD